MSLAKQLYEFEDRLVDRFHSHPFFRGFKSQSDDKLRDYLRQKWLLSQNFVPWYDCAINGIADGESREVLRNILFDETPQNKPSHREDLLADLEAIGIPKYVVLATRPTQETRKALQRLNSLADYSNHPHHDLQVMAALRMAGEILVGEEYRHVVPELERRFGLAPEKSRFYAPHFYHDVKGGLGGAGSHTDSFSAVLDRMIPGEEELDAAVRSSEAAYDARASFFDQFTARYKVVRAAKIGSIAAGVMAAAYLGGRALNIIQNEHERYAQFVNSLEPASKVFYLETDAWLLQRYRETGNVEYLRNIGTFRAVNDVWGDGP